MISDFDTQNIDSIMKLWLDTNISAHYFIISDYWKSNYDRVKEMLPNATIFVYKVNGIIHGFIGLMDNYIAGIFVSNQLQSQGIGKQLLDYAKQKHCDLYLHVYKKNNRAVNFYLRECFIISDEQVDENTSEIELVMNWTK